MTLILDNDEVAASVEIAALVDSLETAYRLDAAGGVETVPRINLGGGQPHGFFRVMPVVVRDMGIMGLKAFAASSDGTVRYVIALWAVESGELLTLMDANYLTAARTGAITGLATRVMADALEGDEVGVIGSGLEGRTNLEAVCAVRPVRRVKVFSPNEARRERFAEEMSERLGIEVTAVESAEAAADTPIVIVATNTGNNSGILALEGKWLRPNAHVNAIGSTMPALREVDPEAFERADLVVLDTLHAATESGDLIAATDAGTLHPDRIRELNDVVTAPRFTADSRPPLTVFKSVGAGLQDIIAASVVFEAAREAGVGREVTFLAEKIF
jgi:alanine dehydrogenase